jgi:hypothetical protein
VAEGYPERGVGTDIVMAIGKSNSGSLFRAIVSLLAGLGIGATLFVHTLMKRRVGAPDTPPLLLASPESTQQRLPARLNPLQLPRTRNGSLTSKRIRFRVYGNVGR